MSVRKISRGVYEVRWREGGRGTPSHARRFAKRDDADLFDREVKRRKRLGTLADLEAGTEVLSDFVKEWARVYALPRLAPSTIRRYAEVWDTHIEPRLGDTRLRDLTPDLVGDFAAALGEAGVGAPTIRKALYVLQSVMRVAVIRRRVPVNPVVLVEKPHQHVRSVRPLPPLVVEALRAQLKPRDATLISVLAYGGARPFEALRLDWADVREKTMRVVDTKRRTERVVRLLSVLAQDLAEYRLLIGRPSSGLVFPRRDGRVWVDTDFRNWRRRVFKPAAAAAGAPNARPYDLRHSFVSLLIFEGKSIAEVAHEAGHSVEECARTYVHVFEEFDQAERVPADEAIRRARGEVADRRSA